MSANLESDLALALLRRLQSTTRPDLRIVVMSATLAAAPIAQYLNGCPILRSEGRLFDLSITHQPYSALALEKQAAAAIENLLSQYSGDILVFLPGAAEIAARPGSASRWWGNTTCWFCRCTAISRRRNRTVPSRQPASAK